MKITKLVHSCLHVEEQSKSVLIDPGNYSVESGALKLDMLQAVDYLLLTHEHPDHMDLPFIKELASKFPNLQIISNESVKNILEKEGVTVTTKGNEIIAISGVPHESTPWMDPGPPQNISFTLFNKLTHPGDSLHFSGTSDILALPVQGSWGSTAQAFNLALKLKPKVIIPIHDWHWRLEARAWYYNLGKKFFSERGIDFRGLEKGVALGK